MIFLPEEETCFHLYEAASVGDVREAATRAGIGCERVADAVDVVPLNDTFDATYAAAGDPVADVMSAFAVTDFTPVDGTPLDVLRECQWTWICTPPPLGPDIHANTDGYGVIAQAFEDVLP